MTFAQTLKVVTSFEDADKVLVVDVANLAHRSMHAYTLTTKDGRFSGHIYGSTYLLVSTLKNHIGPGKLRLALAYEGSGARKARQEILPTYKANRDTPAGQPLPFSPLAEVKEAFQHLPALQMEAAGLEGDDCIAYVCAYLNSIGKKAIVLSGDKDLWALKRFPNVAIYSPNLKRYVSNNDIKEQFFVDEPAKIPLVKALYGDPSDNIKGVERLQKKVVNPVLQSLEHPTVEAFYNCIEGFKPTLQQKLLEARTRVETNFKVIRPRCEGLRNASFPQTPGNLDTFKQYLLSYDCTNLAGQVAELFGAPIYVKIPEE